jgi:thioredoxin 1
MLVEFKDDEKFDQSVVGKDESYVIDFYADWCGPCKNLAPIYAKIAAEYDNVKFFKLNIDNNDPEDSLVKKYGVISLPTILVIKGAEIKTRIVGLMNPQNLRDQIIKSLADEQE